MKYKQWTISPRTQTAFEGLRAEAVPTLVAAVLCARGLESLEMARDFLSFHPKLLCEPNLLRDMDKAIARIELALARGESIAVYGDYDVDGITATCLLTHYLRTRGASVCYYIPSRLEEGYGLNCQAIDTLHAEGVSLIVTVDCGITANEEVEYATACGLDVIITDHHECKAQLPRAVAVVNPHRPDCAYPFAELAGVGVALKLVQALAGAEHARQVLDTYADLTAVGTVADVMKLLGENRALVHMGLDHLQKGARLGLRALLEEAGTPTGKLSSTTIGFCLAPRLNAAGRMGSACIAAELILTEDPLEAARLSHELCELNRERQAVELAIFDACTEQLEAAGRHDSLVLAAQEWHQGVVGIVASRLAERYACPVFMISLQDGRGKGSARSYGGFHLFAALEACTDLLEGYGGHALAAGFSILEENIPAFREQIAHLVKIETGGEERISTLVVDVALQETENLSVEAVDTLAMLEPYGNGNPKPVFALMGARVLSLSEVGGGRHLKLRVACKGQNLDAIFFSVTRLQSGVQAGDLVDLAFYPQINEFRGTRNVQLHLVDLRPAAACTRSDEAVLYARFCQGLAISGSEVDGLIPLRDEFSGLWRYLTSCGGTAEDSAELLAQKAARLSKRPPSATRTRICLDVFEECGLVQLEHRNGRLKVRSRAKVGEKIDLEDSKLMRRLRKLAQGN